jgi:two-component system nitrogen regulation response regulator GlnG
MYSSSPPRTLRVLVADDDDEMRAFVTAALQADGCSTAEAHDGAELLDLLRNALDEVDLRPDVVVADVKMPGLSGLGVLAALQHTKWELPVILITVLTDESIHTVAKRLGAVGILHKPFDPDDLVTAVRNAMAIRELQACP